MTNADDQRHLLPATREGGGVRGDSLRWAATLLGSPRTHSLFLGEKEPCGLSWEGTHGTWWTPVSCTLHDPLSMPDSPDAQQEGAAGGWDGKSCFCRQHINLISNPVPRSSRLRGLQFPVEETHNTAVRNKFKWEGNVWKRKKKMPFGTPAGSVFDNYGNPTCKHL